MLRDFSACKLIFKVSPASGMGFAASRKSLVCSWSAKDDLQPTRKTMDCCRVQLEGSWKSWVSFKPDRFLLHWLFAFPHPPPHAQENSTHSSCSGAALGVLQDVNTRFLSMQDGSESQNGEGELSLSSSQAWGDSESKKCSLLCPCVWEVLWQLSPSRLLLGTCYLLWKQKIPLSHAV